MTNPTKNPTPRCEIGGRNRRGCKRGAAHRVEYRRPADDTLYEIRHVCDHPTCKTIAGYGAAVARLEWVALGR